MLWSCCLHRVLPPNNSPMSQIPDTMFQLLSFDTPACDDRQQYKQKENSIAVKVLMIMILDQYENFIEGKTLRMKHIKEGVG